MSATQNPVALPVPMEPAGLVGIIIKKSVQHRPHYPAWGLHTRCSATCGPDGPVGRLGLGCCFPEEERGEGQASADNALASGPSSGQGEAGVAGPQAAWAQAGFSVAHL